MAPSIVERSTKPYRVYLCPFPKPNTDGRFLRTLVCEDKKIHECKKILKKILTKGKVVDILNSVKLNYYVNQGCKNGC